jgi:RimJ/RimL family protein N-acetyltransferase
LLTEEDRPQIEKWMTDPKIYYYLNTEPLNPKLSVFSWGIRVDGKLIGWANLQNIDYENSKAEYGIAIIDQKHNRLGGIITRSVLSYGFYQLNLNRIYIRPLASNVKSFPDDIRDGSFVREGTERKSVKRGDIYEDVIIMSMFKDEFERKCGKCQRFHI